MTIGSIIIVIILCVSFACAVVFIAKNDGWKGEACQGNCASCTKNCPSHDTLAEEPTDQA